MSSDRTIKLTGFSQNNVVLPNSQYKFRRDKIKNISNTVQYLYLLNQFDLSGKNKLVIKLENVGIREYVLNWFHSYLAATLTLPNTKYFLQITYNECSVVARALL